MKNIFNGVVQKHIVCRGSKSERVAAVLYTSASKYYILRLDTVGPFGGTKGFEEYLGKDVCVKARPLMGNTLRIASEKDISLAQPPKRKTRKP